MTIVYYLFSDGSLYDKPYKRWIDDKGRFAYAEGAIAKIKLHLNNHNMLEDIQKPVEYRDRFAQIYEKTRTNGSTITDTMKYLAQQIEMAYIAGANSVNITTGELRKELHNTGEILVLARNYVKDKGYGI